MDYNDAGNLLIQIDKPGMTVSYRYDGLNRRIENNVNSAITRYVYDEKNILLEFDGTNQLAANYTHGKGFDEPLIMNRGGQPLFYHADGLGSVTDLTDGSGLLVQSYVYNSYGEIVAQTGAVTNPFTYTGREFDPETGLYYYRARMYDPAIGRFLQEDRILLKKLLPTTDVRNITIPLLNPSMPTIQSDPQNLNLYVYALDNPINRIDPTGFFSLRCLAGKAGTFAKCMFENTFGPSHVPLACPQPLTLAVCVACVGTAFRFGVLPAIPLCAFCGRCVAPHAVDAFDCGKEAINRPCDGCPPNA